MMDHEGIWLEYRPTYADHWSGYKRVGDIVRCRDCRFYVHDPDPIDPGWPMMCEWTEMDMVIPDGFCAWGERRGDR